MYSNKTTPITLLLQQDSPTFLGDYCDNDGGAMTPCTKPAALMRS